VPDFSIYVQSMLCAKCLRNQLSKLGIVETGKHMEFSVSWTWETDVLHWNRGGGGGAFRQVDCLESRFNSLSQILPVIEELAEAAVSTFASEFVA